MDFLIDPYRLVPPTPACSELVTYVKQTQGFGGAIVGDGMPQSGDAITARAAFMSSLQSYVWENFDSKPQAPNLYYTYHDWPSYPSTDKLSVFGGLGQIYGSEGVGMFDQYIFDIIVGPAANGRFNTTSNNAGRWGESEGTVHLDLTSTYTAFGCFITDLGDIGGECEIEFWNGASLVRIITAPTIQLDKPGSGEGGWISYANGSTPFNKVRLKVRQFNANPGNWDYVGFDDMIIGQCVTCVPYTLPSTHYGRNTVATPAKTVAGPAKTARDAWVSAAGTYYVHDFENHALGWNVTGFPLDFPGLATVTANAWPYLHTNSGSYPYSNIVADDTNAVIANAGGSARWNTTTAGAKWLEFKDELVINFNRGDLLTKFGFYFTDLGNQNATLRVTFRRTGGAAVVYYVPKAAELASPASLLGFWGVVGELPFLQVVIQVVYYDDLTEGTYSRIPAWASGGAIEMVGIDDILVG